MRLTSVIILFTFLNIYYTYCERDTSQYLYFDYNISQRLIDENLFSLEYKIFHYHSIIFSIGKVFANENHNSTLVMLSPNQDTWPFLAYNGMDYKLGYRFNYHVNYTLNIPINSQFVIKNTLDLYIGPQIILKDLNYRNKEFMNDHGPDEGTDYFERSEDATVKGVNIVIGFRVNTELLHGIIIYGNCFGGIEYRYRYREYTTHSSSNSMVPLPENHPVPLGSYTLKQNYIVPIIGIKLGIGKKF